MFCLNAVATAARSRALAQIGSPCLAAHRDLADQLGELPCLAGILRPLMVHDVLRMTMTGQRGTPLQLQAKRLAGEQRGKEGLLF